MSNEDADFAYKRVPGRFYISREFGDSETGPGMARRFAVAVFEEGERNSFAQIDSEVVLRSSPEGRQQVKALFLSDNRSITNLIIQRFNTKDGTPIGRSLLNLSGEEVDRLRDLLRVVKLGGFDGSGKVRIDQDNLEDVLLSDEAVRHFVLERPELLSRIRRMT